jgi:hypothetical protein
MLPVSVLIRVLLLISAVSWWVLPGMGIIDLMVTWDEDWAVVLEAGWGVFCTVGLGFPFLVAAVRPRLARGALAQVSLLAAALAAAVAGSNEPEAWWMFVMLAIQLPLVHLLAGRTHQSRAQANRLLVLAAAVAAPAWLAYAWSMMAANRELHFDGDITNGVDHYAVQAALGLALVALPAAAGLGVPGGRLLGTATAVMAGYLGLVTYSWVDMEGDLGEAWSVATMAWAAAVLLATWWPSRRPDIPSTAGRAPQLGAGSTQNSLPDGSA